LPFPETDCPKLCAVDDVQHGADLRGRMEVRGNGQSGEKWLSCPGSQLLICLWLLGHSLFILSFGLPWQSLGSTFF
jgi:hypothetical protein